MAGIRRYNQVEVEAVERFREIYATRDAYTVPLKASEDKERIDRLAREALYPEEPEIAYEMEQTEDQYDIAEQGLSKTRQEDALLFHLSARLSGQEKVVRMLSCGGVDDGKSTVIGRILYEAATEERRQEIQAAPMYLRKDGTVDYAMLAGVSAEEARQGITVQVSYSQFQTGSCTFLMADVPGHEEYTGNMAYAAKDANLAVLMISANKGIVPQTRRHIRICSFMGIREMIFAVNKMDMVGFDREVYESIVKEIEYLMQEYPQCHYQIIPVAAKAGDNIRQKSTHMPWYQGKTLLCAITENQGEKEPENSFYLAVQKTIKSSQIAGKEIKKRVLLGQAQGGKIREGDEIFVYPTIKRAKVSRLYSSLQGAKEIGAGQPAAIELDRELDVARGYFLAKEDMFVSAECVEADILWVSDDQLRLGTRYRIKIGAKEITGTVTKILYRVDVNTGDHKFAEHITKNGMARVELRFSEAVAASSVNFGRVLGTLGFWGKKEEILLGYGNIVKTVSDEVFVENGREVTRQEREEALGQKAGIILFPKEEGIGEWINYLERYLLHMGFHTVQIEDGDEERIFRTAQAGLLGLMPAGDVTLPEFMREEPCRVCDLRGDNFSQDNLMNLLRKVKGWVREMLC
ncbi:MAG: GTP-binding protein [Roseburia sp.]|nr:GTP-binding protein [Roseburia sp.]